MSSFNGQYIWTDGTNIYLSKTTGGNQQYVLDKSTSTWSAKTWTGLSNFNGTEIWTDGTNIYYSHGETQKVLDKSTSTWLDKTWTTPYADSLYGSMIWTDGTNIYNSIWMSSGRQYVLDASTSTWYAKTWTGLSSELDGSKIWTDGVNIYCVDGYYNSAVLSRTKKIFSVRCTPNYT